MTTYDYISLFLIDPVLRHTRRWSAFALSERPKDVCAGQVTTAEHATVLEHSVDCSESVAEDLVDPGCALADDEEADRGGLLEVPVVPPDRERALDPTSDPGGEREEAPGRRRHVPADRPEELRRDERVPVRTALRGSAGIEDGSSHASHGVVERFGPPGSSSGVRPRASAGTNFVSMMMVDGSEALPRSVPGRGMSEPGSPEPQASSSVSEILPADDGQRVLRQRILKIRNMPVTASETARLMHELMNERYRQLRAVHQRRPQHRKSPPGPSLSPTPEDQRPAPNAGSGDGREATPSSSSAAPASDDPYHLTVDDLKRTYVPVQSKVPRHGRSQSSHSDLDDDGGQATPHRLGCRHYKRNVKLQCSTCGRWYTCRFCHDEVEDHVLIRKDTEHMLCMLCGCPQPAAETCVNCAESMAWYYCAICKLWDDDSGKSIYHCNDCGICRIGRGLGKDYFHCKTCGVCMSIAIADSHKCIERSTDCDCPICGEYMFNSPETVVFMPCGHSIHLKCYYEHVKTSYRCPLCSKSMVNMETSFRNLDRAIESQPMPTGFRDTKALVYCNDCAAKSSVSYHWLGLKCGLCDSYNTAQIKIFNGPGPERTPLTSAPSATQESAHLLSSSLPAQGPRSHTASGVVDAGSSNIDHPSASSPSSQSRAGPALGYVEAAASSVAALSSRPSGRPSRLQPPAQMPSDAPSEGAPEARTRVPTIAFEPPIAPDGSSSLLPSQVPLSAPSTLPATANVDARIDDSNNDDDGDGRRQGAHDEDEDQEEINFWGEDGIMFGPMTDTELLNSHVVDDDEDGNVSSLVSLDEDDEDDNDDLYDVTDDGDDDDDDRLDDPDDDDHAVAGVSIDGGGSGGGGSNGTTRAVHSASIVHHDDDDDDDDDDMMELIGHR